MRINNTAPANIFLKKLNFCAASETPFKPQIQPLQEDQFYRQYDDHKKYTDARAHFADIAQKQLCFFDPFERTVVARKKDGAEVPIFLSREYYADGWYKIFAEEKETRKDLGAITVGYPRENSRREFPEEGYKMQDGNMKYLWINNLDSYCSDEYQGVGATIFKKIVQDSEFFGFEGRVALRSGRTKEFSPAPFYYKIGLRSIDPAVNERLEQLVPKLKKGEKIRFDSTLDGIMYLPQGTVWKIMAGQ